MYLVAITDWASHKVLAISGKKLNGPSLRTTAPTIAYDWLREQDTNFTDSVPNLPFLGISNDLPYPHEINLHCGYS